MGEVFRARLRQFPSLVTCCTIDWFSPWPREALQSASMCVRIHQSVAEKCGQYRAELSRHNYVTPTSYLELLSVFSALIGRKRQELHGARQRMETGLHKVCPPCRTHGALSQHRRHPDGVSFVRRLAEGSAASNRAMPSCILAYVLAGRGAWRAGGGQHHH
ncbi:hypothetical protein CRUP_038840 [Coryphaenoides rupestris]|nr:hypothetical protein CRUP_038840 [Coryphaenoides rupestris]